MKARVEVDPKGRKSVVGACGEPCAIEKGMRILGCLFRSVLEAEDSVV